VAKNTTWTNNAADRNWNTAGNWSNGVGATGDTLDISTNLYPTSNVPTSIVLNFNITNTVTVTLAGQYLNSGSTVGTLTVANAGAAITTSYNMTAFTVTAGTVYVNGTVTVSGATSNAGMIVLTVGGLIFTGNVTNTGTIDASAAGTTLDFNGAAGITGDGGAIKLSATSAATGILNVTNYTWTVTDGATWTVDLAGTLNLGGVASNLALTLNLTGTATLGGDCTAKGVTLTAGVLAGAYSVTVGAGGWTQTSGTIADGEVSLVVAASCAITFKGTNKLADLKINSGATATYVKVSGSWGVYTRKVSTNGAGLDGTFVGYSADYGLEVCPYADNFWTFTGTVTQHVEIVSTSDGGAARTNTAPISLANAKLLIYRSNSADAAFTFNGRVSNGSGDIRCYGGAAGKKMTATFNGGLTTTGTLRYGNGAAGSELGVVVLGSSVTHTLGPVIRDPLNMGTAHALTFGGLVTLTGNLTLANIAVDFASAGIVASANVTIDGASATSVANTRTDLFSNGSGKNLTISNIGTLATPLRAWCGCTDGTGNGANVTFHRGAPSALALVGAGGD
jgi:hypothetical protein